MKKFNALLFGSFMMLVAALPFQTLSAIEVPLKKGDIGGSTIGPSSLLRVSSLRTVSSITPVSADLSETELVLNFSSPIGTALVTVEDQMGGIVYVYSINTYSTSELVIPIDGWEIGNYTLTISYGTKTLTGDFNL